MVRNTVAARGRLRRISHRVRRLMRVMGLEAIYQAPRTSMPHPEHRNRWIPICSRANHRPAQSAFLVRRWHHLHPRPTASCTWSDHGLDRHVLSWRLEHHGRLLLHRGVERRAGHRTQRRRSSTPTRAVFTSLEFTGALKTRALQSQ